MQKKKQITSKILLARARKIAVEDERKEREAREREDQEWREAEGPKSRAAKKREEKNERRAKAAAKKADARRLASEEEREHERTIGNRNKKVTAFDLLRCKEREQAGMNRRLVEEKKKQSRSLDEYEYEKMTMVTNNNRDDSIIDARSVKDAVAQMTLVDDFPPDKHPERRLKASYRAFEKVEIQRLKEDKPGLTLGQYSNMSWKQWKKSADNPVCHVKNCPRFKTSDRDHDDYSLHD